MRLGAVGIGCGVPDFHRAEMRAVGIGVAGVLDDGHVPGVELALERGEGGVEADLVVELEGGILRDADGGPGLVIEVVAEGDDGVEPIVAAAQLEDDEDGRVRLRGDGPGGAGDEGGHVGAGGDQAEAFDAGGEELAAGLEEAGVWTWVGGAMGLM